MKTTRVSEFYFFAGLLIMISFPGCGIKGGSSASVKKNSTVWVEYVASLKNGDIFDKTSGDMPRKIKLDSPNIVEGLRTGMIGMKKGETRTLIIEPEHAYGTRDEKKRLIIKNDKIPDNFIPEPGKVLRMISDDGALIIGIVTNILPDGIELDTNHLLAGEELIYKIKVLEIE